jgi:DNA-binding transcriptional ArsR family regulator
MSSRPSGPTALRRLQRHASLFAALGDETRLSLLARLCDAHPWSISHLAERSPITRQAITKHLRVLESAGLVKAEIVGRECLFELQPKALQEVKDYLALVSTQWEQALGRLKTFVEKD